MKSLKFLVFYLLISSFLQSNAQKQNGWIIQQSGVTTDLNDVFFIDNNTGWCVGKGGIILSTINGGKAWSVTTITSYKDLNCIQFFTKKSGLVAGNNGTLLKTTDGGLTWQSINTGITENFIKLFFLDSLIGWGIIPGGIYKTTNGGNTWTSQLTFVITPQQFLKDIFFTDANHGWAVGLRKFYKTTDGGQNWLIDSNQLGVNNAIFFSNANTGFLCCLNILKLTNDGGNTWRNDTTFQSSYYDAFFVNDKVGWFITLALNSTLYYPTKYNVGDDRLIRQNIFGFLQQNYSLSQVFAIDESTAWCVGKGGTIIHLENNGINNGLKYLDINNYRAIINPDNTLFWDMNNCPSDNYIPKDGGKSTIFASTLWIAGYDDGGNLHEAAQTYRQSGTDFWPGPINLISNKGASPKDWQKCWLIDKSVIDNHIANWNKPGYNLPDDIKNWPGNGPDSFAKILAPFFDLNNNQIYEPEKGEYPKILGDQAIFFLYNDQYGIHQETQALPMGIEVQGMAFEYAMPWVEAIHNTVFVKYRITNRSDTNYKNVLAGIWTDFDLGYAYDDFVGSDSQRSMYFAYNGDDFDDGSFGYGPKPPAQAVLFLNDTMSHFIKYDNDFSLKGNPSEAIHYSYYLEGRFKNGQYLRYGGDGFHNVWVNRNVSYMFPAAPDQISPHWSEASAGNNPSDRRCVGSIGPFNLPAGATKEIYMAYVFAQSDTGGYLGSYYKMINAVDVVRDHYQRGIITSDPQKNPATIDPEVKIYPNPSNGTFVIALPDLANESFNILITDISGRVVYEQYGVEDRYTQIQSKFSAKGLYIVTTSSNTRISKQKLIIE